MGKAKAGGIEGGGVVGGWGGQAALSTTRHLLRNGGSNRC